MRLLKLSLIFLSLIIAFSKPAFAEKQPEETFEAKVLDVLNEKKIQRDNGVIQYQQDLKLLGITGFYKDKEVVYKDISDYGVFTAFQYKKGDKVLVSANVAINGETLFLVTDPVRRESLYLLAGIFGLLVVTLGGWRGVRSILSLAATILVIIKFISPMILDGANPVLISAVGGFAILVFVIYLTEGISKKSHLASLSIFICLLLTLALSIGFTNLTKLSGFASEETMFLLTAGRGLVNFQGLLLAGILIGTLGVLDDVAISQIEAVGQIREANPGLSDKKTFGLAFKLGNAHLGAVVNSLFLAYAGASLPLLMLFNLQEPPFQTLSQVINNEIIATEIVRTLIGSIGLALAIPISTLLATRYCTPRP